MSSAAFLFLYAVHVFIKICQQILINIYLGLSQYSVAMIWLMLQILDMLPKAMYQVTVYETGKDSEQSKGYLCSLFRFFCCAKKSYQFIFLTKLQIPFWCFSHVFYWIIERVSDLWVAMAHLPLSYGSVHSFFSKAFRFKAQSIATGASLALPWSP